ncbi:MAG: hypothetical protein JW722_06320 [Demequinaceae bacterium]|nr:hypothetical protein [Demequinaceae bacterium]
MGDLTLPGTTGAVCSPALTPSTAIVLMRTESRRMVMCAEGRRSCL